MGTTVAGDGTTTECDCSAFECDEGENGAGSASLSLVALLLPAVFACLLWHACMILSLLKCTQNIICLLFRSPETYFQTVKPRINLKKWLESYVSMFDSLKIGFRRTKQQTDDILCTF